MSARAAVADSWAVLGAIRGEGEAARTMRRLLQRARAGNLRLLLNLVNLGEIYYRLIQITGQSAADEHLARLRISCVHCGRPVALVGDISLSVLTLLATHLQRRHPGEQVGAHPGEDAILSHFAITPVNPGSEPPDAA